MASNSQTRINLRRSEPSPASRIAITPEFIVQEGGREAIERHPPRFLGRGTMDAAVAIYQPTSAGPFPSFLLPLYTIQN